MRIRPLIFGCAIALLPISAAAQTGGISGTVTRSDTSAPLAGASVEVTGFVDDETQTFSAITNASGLYTISGLAPGTYHAWTNIGSGFINEIYDNLPCSGFCTSFAATMTGAPIAVVAGVTTTNRNFALAPGGSIRGIVTDQASGLPLNGVSVSIVRNFAGGGITTVTTNAAGQFTTSLGLATGTYYAYTSNNAGYLNEVYDNLDCGINCLLSPAILNATPIAVTAPAQTTGVNFALVKGATLSGIVTDASTGTALEGVSIAVANAQGQVVLSDNTNASGIYLAQGLPAGTYYAFTGNAAGYINEVYDNIPCVGQCTSSAGGTPIQVSAGAAVTERNFALARGGRISGTVLSAASLEPVSARVHVYSSTAALVTEAETDSSGAYISYAGLPAGIYYIRVQNDDVYVDEIYDNITCIDCQPYDIVTLGTPIAVATGATTTGRNFLLSRGGAIAGRVTRAATGGGVAGAGVSAYGPGNNHYSAETDANGDYAIEGLPPGSYVLHTRNDAGSALADEIYDNIPCVVRCDESAARFRGSPVTVAIAATTPGIDFVLTSAGTMVGTVTAAGTGAPLPDVAIYVVGPAYDTTAFPAEYTDQSGAFTLTGLPTGSYYLYTANESGFIDEMFGNGNLPCLGGCPGAAVLGALVGVTGGLPTTGVDFALDPGGRISGVVRDGVTSAGVTSAAVDIVDAGGRLVQTAFAGFSGAYITATGLAAGTYYANARVDDLYLAEVYGGAACPGTCSPTTAVALGTPIVVAAGTTTAGRDFALERGAQIAGILVEAGSGVPIEEDNPVVNFYDSVGRFATAGLPREDGTYLTSPAVPSGTYFGFTTVRTHVNEIYDDIPCPAGCEPSRAQGGTPIVAAAGSNVEGRHFALARRAGLPGPPRQITFRAHPQGVLIAWQPPVTGGVAQTYRLEAGVSPGTTAVSLLVSEPQYLAVGAPAGQFFVRVRAINASGTGPASPDALLVNGAGGPLPGVPTTARAWMHGSRLMMTWDDPGFGGVPTHYLVEAGTAAGLANIATIPAARRAFTYTPVPAGSYFLRVRAVNATGASAPSNDVMLVVGGAVSPPRAPREVGATAAGSTVSLTWSAPGGTVSGYVIEAGSAPGLSNLAVLPIGPVTTISFPGIPPGTYYVRIRALNSQGPSVVSEEMVIVVG